MYDFNFYKQAKGFNPGGILRTVGNHLGRNQVPYALGGGAVMGTGMYLSGGLNPGKQVAAKHEAEQAAAAKAEADRAAAAQVAEQVAAEQAAAEQAAAEQAAAEAKKPINMLKGYYNQGMGYVNQGIGYAKAHPWQVGIPAALGALGLGALYYNRRNKKKKED